MNTRLKVSLISFSLVALAIILPPPWPLTETYLAWVLKSIITVIVGFFAPAAFVFTHRSVQQKIAFGVCFVFAAFIIWTAWSGIHVSPMGHQFYVFGLFLLLFFMAHCTNEIVLSLILRRNRLHDRTY